MAKILINSQYIEVQCERDDKETHNQMELFYPYTQNRIKTVFKLSLKHLPEVIKVMRGIDDIPGSSLPEHVKEQALTELRRRSKTKELVDFGPEESCMVTPYLELTQIQQAGRELARINNKYAFYYDTRTGKTPLTLSVIYDDIVKHPGNKWIVVCPLILIENAWVEDIKKFFPDGSLSYSICHATTKAKRLQAIRRNVNLYIINTESYANFSDELFQHRVCGVCVDESSTMKSPASKISKALIDTAQKVQRFYILSGTPAPNGEWEYYTQMKAVDFYGWHQSYSQFKANFFDNMSYNPQYEKLRIKADKRDELMSMIKKTAIYVDKMDVLDLPGREFIVERYDLNPEHMKLYNKMKRDLTIEVDEAIIVTVDFAAAKVNKLNQISSGFVIDTESIDSEVHYIDYGRFDLLEKMLKRTELRTQQVLIWAHYRAEFVEIQKRLGTKCAILNGTIDAQQKTINIQAFKSGKVQYLVANPGSADKGLTLTNAHFCIYFSLNFSYELYKQSYDRIYGDRRIQPHFCKYFIIVATGTIDEAIYFDVLQNKQDVSYAMLNHLKGAFYDKIDKDG